MAEEHEQKPSGEGGRKAKPPAIRGETLWAGAIGAAATLGVLVVAGLVTVYGGTFNPAATQDHRPVTRWALSTAMRNGVEGRAGEVGQPPGNPDLAAGGRAFAAMCAHCHGAPGARRAEWARGMLPLPPDLTHAAEEWRTEEVFWIAKHGVKMSGMPAFGPTHDDAALWNLAAFVKQLPAMTPEEYAALTGGGGHHDGGTEGARPPPAASATASDEEGA
ncbi:MAG: c-type cytochrome [Phenylobacterium sp.]|uniref:c-type cytochrome n=1 Tax=Phenylobacterium sp. TaxID=1871053 RepID=UPI00391BEE05